MKTFQLKFMRNRTLIRWLQLLNEFEKSPSRTLGELAEVTESSTRTLITDIASLREYFKGAMAIHTAKIGYLFEEIDHDRYRKQKQELIKDEPIFQILESIFYNEQQTLFDWSLTLNISEQALISYFRKIQPFLSPFCLKIKTDPVSLAGSEIDIRKFFCLFY
ncbi:MAG: helix-turn-helix domain-containing protein, partial [Enterococcus casseliflavus]